MAVRIPIDEFKAHMGEVFERVWRDREMIEIEVDRNKIVTLHPGADALDLTQADYEAFMSSFGGWRDLDADQFLKDVYASRDQSKREPVEL